MAVTVRLRQLAANPRFADRPPGLFRRHCFPAAGPAFLAEAWTLFRATGTVPDRLVVLKRVAEAGRGPRRDIMAEVAGAGVGRVSEVFLDSGAFTLWQKAGRRDDLSFYDTDEFWQYMEAYVRWVKKATAAGVVALYATVDAIGSPELTWRNQQWLEKHGLTPVPVVHYGTDLKWLRHYVRLGYDLIGLGGLVRRHGSGEGRRWVDRCFAAVCDAAGRPTVKFHGFGLTDTPLILRWPWWSVDASTWAKEGGFGGLMIPYRGAGGRGWDFDRDVWRVKVSATAPTCKRHGRNYHTLTPLERQHVEDWLEDIGVPLGRTGPDGTVLEEGVATHHADRRAANLKYFVRLVEHVNRARPWPWAWRPPASGLGVCE